jgi:type I restriction enzyme S subunit
MKYGLSDDQLQEIINFIKQYPEVEEAVLFGSRALDTFKEASDVDIALMGEKVTHSLASKIKFNIEEDTYLPFFFDFVAYPTITNKELKEHIDTKGITLYRKGWRECKLGEAPFDIIDGDRGINYPKQDEFSENGYCLFLNAKNVTKEGFLFDECYFITKEKDQILRKGKLKRNDIVLTTRGTVGNIGFYHSGVPFEHIRINSGMVIIRPDTKEILPEYTFYLFKNLKSEFDVFATGSAQPQLPIRDLKEISFYLPSLPEQRAIASVLSSLDDKIDLLHRQNKTLEAMAETLFRQWFVEEADEGWEEGSLLELIQLVGGGTPKTSISDYWDGDIPWLAGGDIASNHKSFILKTEKTITEKGLKNSSAKLLPKYATIISARGTVGKYCLLAQPMAFSQSNYGILPKVDNCYFFTYLLINHLVEELQSSAYGSVFDTITTITFKENSVLIPPKDKIISFETTVFPYFDKMFVNGLQIHTLEKLRDTLLPKLMSGEVRVNV